MRSGSTGVGWQIHAPHLTRAPPLHWYQENTTATLQVPKNDERRRREARYLPGEEKLELAMGRQQ